jgi:carboxymethylenebutenolidase
MKNKYLVSVIVIGIIIVAGVALGYYFGYDIGFEKAVDPNDLNVNMLTTGGEQNVVASDVVYYNDVTGYFAQPKEAGNYPGVVMIHEWWGLNDNIKQMAEQLASEGYIVLAVDLFGTVATTPDEARAQTGALDQAEALNNLQAAADFLRERDAQKVASLGWCFGGGQSMQLALSGEDLDATVIYYGNLETDPEKLADISWPVLGVFGDQDTSIPVATVNEFDVALDQAGVDNQVYIYPGVGHAFANPSGANYAPDATMDAWEKTLSFLEAALQ